MADPRCWCAERSRHTLLSIGDLQGHNLPDACLPLRCCQRLDVERPHDIIAGEHFFRDQSFDQFANGIPVGFNHGHGALELTAQLSVDRCKGAGGPDTESGRKDQIVTKPLALISGQ